jgi:hypothetical protein
MLKLFNLWHQVIMSDQYKLSIHLCMEKVLRKHLLNEFYNHTQCK